MATEITDITEEFDCVGLFDLVTTMAAPNCPADQQDNIGRSKILEAQGLLSQHKLVSEFALVGVSVKFCPLTHGLGLVRQSNEILIDDGLRLGSRETLAEVIAHELAHITQMRELGEDRFKCSYIKELLNCGCMDKHHVLEAPAYAVQTKVRDFLLGVWLKN